MTNSRSSQPAGWLKTKTTAAATSAGALSLALLCATSLLSSCGLTSGHGSVDAGIKHQANGEYRAAYIEAGSTPLANERATMPYYTVPADVIEDPGACLEWARAAIAIGHATAKKVKRARS